MFDGRKSPVISTINKLLHDLLFFDLAFFFFLNMPSRKELTVASNQFILIIVIIVLPASGGPESCLSLIVSLLFCLVSFLLSVIPLKKMQLGKVVFVGTPYAGIDSSRHSDL